MFSRFEPEEIKAGANNLRRLLQNNCVWSGFSIYLIKVEFLQFLLTTYLSSTYVKLDVASLSEVQHSRTNVFQVGISIFFVEDL